MKKLTREDILEGANKTITLPLAEYNNAEVTLRPLNYSEISKILEMMGPMQLSPDGSPDPTKTVELHKNFEALRLAASMALVSPELKPEDISKMKFSAIARIGSAALEMSGLASAEEVKKKTRYRKIRSKS
jgi:hypothetical protein